MSLFAHHEGLEDSGAAVTSTVAGLSMRDTNEQRVECGRTSSEASACLREARGELKGDLVLLGHQKQGDVELDEHHKHVPTAVF